MQEVYSPSSLNDRVSNPSFKTPKPFNWSDKLGLCTRLQPPIIAVLMWPFSIICLAKTTASTPPVNDENIVKLGPIYETIKFFKDFWPKCIPLMARYNFLQT